MSYDRYKKVIRLIIRLLLVNDISWYLSSPLLSKVPYVNFLRCQTVKIKNQKKIDDYFGDLTVKNGIFTGLIYPKLASSGSAVYPKLLGSYEAELHELIKRLVDTTSYDLIVDIGCAEGYYLTGLALKFPTAKLYGVDISEVALDQSRAMLSANFISDTRYHLYTKYDPNLIMANKDRKTLIISDCEGFEDSIFTEAFVPNLNNHYILIECHDFIIPGITNKLSDRLKTTHELTIIETIEDEKKLSFIPVKLKALAYNEKLALVREGRPAKMCWIFATPKNLNV